LSFQLKIFDYLENRGKIKNKVL